MGGKRGHVGREGVMGWPSETCAPPPPLSPHAWPHSRRCPGEFPLSLPLCALQELHHQGPGEEPASVGPPLHSFRPAAWGPPAVGFHQQICGQVCLEGSRNGGRGGVGRRESAGTRRARGSGGTARQDLRPPPPTCQHLWVVPYAGRNPPMLVGRALAEPSTEGARVPTTPRNGWRGPAGGAVRGHIALAWPSLGFLLGYKNLDWNWVLFDCAWPLWAPVRLDTPVKVTNIL